MVQILNLITTAIFLAATTHLTKGELTPWLAQLGWLWDVLGDIIIAYLVIIILMRLVLLLARIKRLITIHGSTKILHAFTTEFFLTAINSNQHTCCPCSDLDPETLRPLPSEIETAAPLHVKQNQHTPQEKDKLNSLEDQGDITQDKILIRKRTTNKLHTRIGSEIEHPFHLQIAKANRPPPNFDKVEKETEEIKSQTNPELDPQQMGKEMMELYKTQAKTHRDASKSTADNQNPQ